MEHLEDAPPGARHDLLDAYAKDGTAAPRRHAEIRLRGVLQAGLCRLDLAASGRRLA